MSSQVWLMLKKNSRIFTGLIDAQEKLKNIHQIDFVHFSAKDVVRHPVVAQIIRAYEPLPVKAEEKQEETE